MDGQAFAFAPKSIAFQSRRRANVVPLHPPQHRPIDPKAMPPDYRLVIQLGPLTCLRLGLLPWRKIGGYTIILSPDLQFPPKVLVQLEQSLGPVRLAVCSADNIQTALLRVVGPELADEAENRVPLDQSCRGWNNRKLQRGMSILAVAIVTLLYLSPAYVFLVLLGWACLTLVLNTGLKVAAAATDIIHRNRAKPADKSPALARLPVVSILVPLYHEKEVAGHIVKRMSALDYPSDCLDVCLIIEDNDALTQNALRQAALPDWAQVIEVPQGTLRTKPRALNYALTRARGSIIGIYDAEDAPEPDQLRKVVQRFAERNSQVACLQGKLDYYNPHCNWIARCFTLEYATWFRLILPGLQRLGLVIPLGGTTLFLRREAIEDVGGWDAHNVTEDADLGLRLARAGYHTEIIDTVTFEEANAIAWPWVRQRSRWLKGYGMTWAVHMRQPRQLLRDLGAWRFFGVQMLFLGTLSGFVLAPLIWSFWLLLLGLPHPLRGIIPSPVLMSLAYIFLLTEILNIMVTSLAIHRAGRPMLALWTPLLQLYFPMATLAVYKAIAEMVTKPFYWDKTTHGLHTTPDQDTKVETGHTPNTAIVSFRPALHPVAAE